MEKDCDQIRFGIQGRTIKMKEKMRAAEMAKESRMLAKMRRGTGVLEARNRGKDCEHERSFFF